MSDPGYELIDSGDQAKLERFGDVVVVRPSAQAVWERREPRRWKSVDAIFERDSGGEGTWRVRGNFPEEWSMAHARTVWQLRPNSFGHLGIFPEQEPCWQWIRRQIEGRDAPVNVLNLFGYTGGSSLHAAAAGASVCHLDASKTSVKHARENARLSGLEEHPIRWITDDAQRFVEREVRRERRYDGIILDPPTYGRGTKGEIWKIDDHLRPLLEKCRKLLSDDPCFFLLSSHSPGYTPLVLSNVLAPYVPRMGEHQDGEMVIRDGAGRPLPSGAYARWGICS